MARDDKKISGKGIHVNKKNAREEAALQILRVLYEGFPHIYEEIARIKAERALEWMIPVWKHFDILIFITDYNLSNI